MKDVATVSAEVKKHASAPTLSLIRDVRDSISTRIIPIDHPPASWPATDAGKVPANLTTVCADILHHLWDEPGWILVDTGLADRNDRELVSAAWNLFSTLCRPVPQYRTGELVYFVEVASKSIQASSHYSQSNKSDGFHTDGTLLDTTPEMAMLAGIHTADEGGETVIIDGRPIVARLFERSRQSLTILEELHPFHSGDDDDPVVTHKIIDHITRSPVIRYMRRYIEFGYAQRRQQVSENLEMAFQGLDALTDKPEYQAAILINRGYLLLWNNQRFLHGRRPFKEFRERRRLLRTYGTRFPSASYPCAQPVETVD